MQKRGADSEVQILRCEGVRILGCKEGADFRVLKKGVSESNNRRAVRVLPVLSLDRRVRIWNSCVVIVHRRVHWQPSVGSKKGS